MARGRSACRSVLGVGAALATLAAACAQFSGSDGSAEADGGGVDATASDGGTVRESGVPDDVASGPAPDVDAGMDAGFDASDAGIDPNVLFASDFETGSDCAGWTPFNATAVPTTDFAHTGSRSCRICFTGPNEAQIGRTVQGRGPGTYSLSFWVRDDGNGGGWSAFMRGSTDGGDEILVNNGGPVGSSFTAVNVIGGASDAREYVQTMIIESGSGCVDVDDVVLRWDP